MSIDIIVATQKKISTRTLESIGRLLETCEFSSYNHEGCADGEYTRNSDFFCSVSGPSEYEASEYIEEFGSFAGIKYIYEIGAPSKLEENVLFILMDITENIVEMGTGAAYDPQSGKIIFQSAKLPTKANTPTKRKKIDLLCIDFVLKPKCIDDGGKVLIEILEEHCPCAIPLRLDGSSFPKELKVSDKEEFYSKWKEYSSQDSRCYVSWTGKSPLLSASISFGAPLEEGTPERYSVRHELNLKFNTQALNEVDIDESGRLARRLVSAITAKLDTIYVASYVARNYELTARNNYWFLAHESEVFQTNPGFWAGIPNFPFWLTWFCEEYKLLIEECCDGDTYEVEDLNNGLLLKMSDRPKNKDEVIADYPKFPTEYMIPAKTLPKFERETKE